MLNQAEYYVKTNATNIPEIQASIDAISHYITEGVYHESKDIRLKQWSCYEGDLFELVISILTIALQGPYTYQSMIGMLADKIPMKAKYDRLQTIAEVIAVISITGLIRITKMGNGKSVMVDTIYTLDNIPTIDKHEIVMKAPNKITENSTEQEGSMILGSRFNFHNDNICLDHINRMNAIKLQLNIPFLCAIKEEPKDSFDTTEQQEQWDIFVKESRSKYLSIGKKIFHQLHKYDARGRCYSMGYHVNYQGSSFKKAIIQLANPEVVKS